MKAKDKVRLLKYLLISIVIIVSLFFIDSALSSKDDEKIEILNKKIELLELSKIDMSKDRVTTYNVNYTNVTDSLEIPDKDITSYWYVCADYGGGVNFYEAYESKGTEFDYIGLTKQVKKEVGISKKGYMRISFFKRMSLEKYLEFQKYYQ